MTDLAQSVAEVARREPVYEEFRNHGQKIRLHGDAAIAVGIISIRSRSTDGGVLEAISASPIPGGYRDAHGGWRPATPARCRADRACAASGGQRNAVFTACWDARRVSH